MLDMNYYECRLSTNMMHNHSTVHKLWITMCNSVLVELRELRCAISTLSVFSHLSLLKRAITTAILLPCNSAARAWITKWNLIIYTSNIYSKCHNYNTSHVITINYFINYSTCRTLQTAVHIVFDCDVIVGVQCACDVIIVDTIMAHKAVDLCL